MVTLSPLQKYKSLGPNEAFVSDCYECGWTLADDKSNFGFHDDGCEKATELEEANDNPALATLEARTARVRASANPFVVNMLQGGGY